jgi:hypothetical protein
VINCGTLVEELLCGLGLCRLAFGSDAGARGLPLRGGHPTRFIELAGKINVVIGKSRILIIRFAY